VTFHENDTKDVVLDGFYITNYEIQTCHFTADSILNVLDQDRLRVMHTRRFHPGDNSTQLFH
jgi:hypothetical protein